MIDHSIAPAGAQDSAARARFISRVRAADAAGCPVHRATRAVAFDEAVAGPFIDAVDDAIDHAFAESDAIGDAPAMRVLVSGPGAGKSTALVYACAWHGRPCGSLSAVFVRAPTLARTHRAMHDNRTAWERWLRSDLLCVDELGTEEKPEVITELLLERWDAGRITLCASNLTEIACAERYFSDSFGLRLRDRAAGQTRSGLPLFVTSNEASLRMRAEGDR